MTAEPAGKGEALHYGTHGGGHGTGSPVPQDPDERLRLRQAAHTHARQAGLVPPLSMSELEEHAEAVLKAAAMDAGYRVFAMVLLYNEAWLDAYAAIPYSRRIFLLPPCMRSSEACPAQFDELGLICKRCGECDIGPLVTEAEAMGYAVLVAEGTSTVTTLIETGQMQGAMGLSCMAALERAFPHMAEQPIPSLAIPLLHDGCKDTTADLEWVREAMHLAHSGTGDELMDLVAVHREVASWFDEGSIRSILQLGDSETEQISLEWLAKSGKRWRPFLAVCVYKALAGNGDGALPETVRQIAMAVECVHKGSLIYDDIQDDDDIRYGEPTVYQTHGVPIALNIGLDLIGQGYRLIAESGASAEQTADMLTLATRGHCQLCIGQGAELCWGRKPEPLTPERVLEMFRMKTAPSFVVVFGLGAILGGADANVREALNAYSEALGVAYQIQDDLDDFIEGSDGDDVKAGRASLSLAYAHQAANDADRAVIERAWREGADKATARHIRQVIASHGTEKQVIAALCDYKARALAALRPLDNIQLKVLLHRIAGKILKSG